MRVKYLFLLLSFSFCSIFCSCAIKSTESSASFTQTSSQAADSTYNRKKESSKISVSSSKETISLNDDTAHLDEIQISTYEDSFNSSEDKIPSSDEMGEINHGVISPDPIDTNFTLTYDGNPIELTYMMENGASSNLWGLSIFVNGKQQPFSVNDNANILAYNSRFDSNERKELNIKFIPVSGEKGEIVTVYFVVMVNPEFISNPNKPFYGYNHTITQMPWKINMVEGSPNKIDDISDDMYTVSDLSQSYKENYIIGEEDGTEISLLDFNTYIEFYQSYPMENSISFEDNMTLQINIAGDNEICDKKTFYRISVYADHQVVKCFDDKPYADVCVERNKLSSIKFSLKENDLAGKNHIYLIAIPIKWNSYDKGILSIIKTETKPIK